MHTAGVLPKRRADAAALTLAPKTDPPKNDAAERTAAYLAEQARTAEEAHSPEAQAARRKVMERIRGMTQ